MWQAQKNGVPFPFANTAKTVVYPLHIYTGVHTAVTRLQWIENSSVNTDEFLIVFTMLAVQRYVIILIFFGRLSENDTDCRNRTHTNKNGWL